MARKKQQKSNGNGGWWKVLIMLTFIISLSCLGILVKNKLPRYEYKTQIIKLDNSNYLIYERVEDYLCDEGVETYNSGRYFYASTWEKSDSVKPQYKGMSGQCMIKIKYKVE